MRSTGLICGGLSLEGLPLLLPPLAAPEMFQSCKTSLRQQVPEFTPNRALLENE